jgi:hypothetical protein
MDEEEADLNVCTSATESLPVNRRGMDLSRYDHHARHASLETYCCIHNILAHTYRYS